MSEMYEWFYIFVGISFGTIVGYNYTYTRFVILW